jgi:transposase
MHIVENYNKKVDRIYCYAAECHWDKQSKTYRKPRISVGHLEGTPPVFVPNKRFSRILASDLKTPSLTDEHTKEIITTVTAKYGEVTCSLDLTDTPAPEQTARAVFSGPSIVFGGITERYRIDTMLRKTFGADDAQDILSLAWYLASEGDALSNSDAWLEQYETPSGHGISSQEITRLLDRMDQDGLMTFYKDWLRNFQKSHDKVLYDLTSISWYGQGINMAGWGRHHRDEHLPQVNFALLCARNTAMPLFAWPLEGSITDVQTLQNTLQFLEKLEYKPDTLMLDRGFASIKNIDFMLKEGITFLQALRVNANWIYDIIDEGRASRLRPDSMLKVDERTYYASTTACQWVTLEKTEKRGDTVEKIFVYHCKEKKGEKYIAKDGERILSQHSCKVHVLFCQDLVGNQWDRFMEKLNKEYQRLMEDEEAEPASELKKYFCIERKKWARKRSVEFNMENITKQRNNYAGHICFITNDKTIPTAKDALKEYSTRDYIEKDFDELKNDLDMRRIRVHTDGRMKARLFIQFIAEIYIREIRVLLRNEEVGRKMTRKQIASHIKGIYKIKFKGKYRDVCPELSKAQRMILEALGIRDSR